MIYNRILAVFLPYCHCISIVYGPYFYKNTVVNHRPGLQRNTVTIRPYTYRIVRPGYWLLTAMLFYLRKNQDIFVFKENNATQSLQFAIHQFESILRRRLHAINKLYCWKIFLSYSIRKSRENLSTILGLLSMVK